MIKQRIIVKLKPTFVLMKAIIFAPIIILIYGFWELLKYFLKITLKVLFFLILILIYYFLVPFIPNQHKGWYFFALPLFLISSIVSKLPWWIYFIQPQTIIYKK